MNSSRKYRPCGVKLTEQTSIIGAAFECYPEDRRAAAVLKVRQFTGRERTITDKRFTVTTSAFDKIRADGIFSLYSFSTPAARFTSTAPLLYNCTLNGTHATNPSI